MEHLIGIVCVLSNGAVLDDLATHFKVKPEDDMFPVINYPPVRFWSWRRFVLFECSLVY